MDSLVAVILGGLIGVIGTSVGAFANYWFTRRLEFERREFEWRLKQADIEREERREVAPTLSDIEKRVVKEQLSRGGRLLSRMPKPGATMENVFACFPADASVLSPDGSYVELRSVTEGQRVATFDIRSQQVDSEVVSSIRRNEVDSLIELNGSFRATPNQQLYVNGHYAEASVVKIGWKLAGLHAEEIPITEIKLITGRFDVVSLVLDSGDAYWVRPVPGQSPFLVREAATGKFDVDTLI